MKWQSKEGLKALTISLCEYASVTGSQEEIGIMEFVDYELRTLTYFSENSDHLQTHYTDDGRKFVTALVKSKEPSAETIILMGHLDVVDVEDYGEWKNLAFRPRELTVQMLEQRESLPDFVQKDLEKDEWIFGRGVMDMKAGIALSMSMIEAAAAGEFEGNLMLLAVPDEEVNSAGMRTAVPVLQELARHHNLNYKVVWNTEPMFTKYPGDTQRYLYQGSLGKILPGFYCYGEEAHVAEPFSGLNGNFMASHITSLLELNPMFTEKVEEEKTPPPANLIQKDLKEEYSTQIPHAAVTIFNLMSMGKPLKEVTKDLLEIAGTAAENIIRDYNEREKKFAETLDYIPRKRNINIYTYEQLWDLAVSKVGEEEAERMLSYLQAEVQGDDRELSYRIVHEMASVCKDKAPMIVLFYAPPYYPPVSSKGDKTIDTFSSELIKIAKDESDIDLEMVNYFPGLSDLSYTSLPGGAEALTPLLKNMPLWGVTYDLPLAEMEELNMSMINFGPDGRDPHSWLERLNVTYSFEKLPPVMKKGIKLLFEEADEEEGAR